MKCATIGFFDVLCICVFMCLVLGGDLILISPDWLFKLFHSIRFQEDSGTKLPFLVLIPVVQHPLLLLLLLDPTLLLQCRATMCFPTLTQTKVLHYYVLMPPFHVKSFVDHLVMKENAANECIMCVYTKQYKITTSLHNIYRDIR